MDSTKGWWEDESARLYLIYSISHNGLAHLSQTCAQANTQKLIRTIVFAPSNTWFWCRRCSLAMVSYPEGRGSTPVTGKV